MKMLRHNAQGFALFMAAGCGASGVAWSNLKGEVQPIVFGVGLVFWGFSAAAFGALAAYYQDSTHKPPPPPDQATQLIIEASQPGAK